MIKTDKIKLKELFTSFGLILDEGNNIVSISEENRELGKLEGWCWAQFEFDETGKFIKVDLEE